MDFDTNLDERKSDLERFAIEHTDWNSEFKTSLIKLLKYKDKFTEHIKIEVKSACEDFKEADSTIVKCVLTKTIRGLLKRFDDKNIKISNPC